MTEYSIADGDKVEKYHIALLFNSGTSESPAWVQLAKSTENTITLNAETEDRDFITDQNPTTLVKKYKPSINTPLTLFKGEADYEYFWPKFYELPTGSNANGELLVVFMNEKNSSKYDAWKVGVTFIFDNLDPVNSQLTLSVNFNGTITQGTVTVSSGTPTFEAKTAA